MTSLKSSPPAGRQLFDPAELRKAFHAGTLPMFLLEHPDAYPMANTPLEIWDEVLRLRAGQLRPQKRDGALFVCRRGR